MAAAIVLIFVSVLVLWIAIHKIPWLGPFLADGARLILGPQAVGRLEDMAYGIDDRWNRARDQGKSAQGLWEVPFASGASAGEIGSSALSPAFRPEDLPPIHSGLFARGDGVWVPIANGPGLQEDPLLFKTLLHPDLARVRATVAVVAVDLRRVTLSLLPGTTEPESTMPEAAAIERPGRIPEADWHRVIAAFNGGFKTIHGRMGMGVGPLTLVPPRGWACTVARNKDGSVAIRSWPELAGTQLDWWRQTPSCLVEVGEFGHGVTSETNINWGRAVSGSTIIRRSAIGINRDGTTLFVGMGYSTSAKTMAVAMRHAGAYNVAQLDVNAPFVKFLIFERDGSDRSMIVGTPLTPWMSYDKNEFTMRPVKRDFFYLTTK